MSEAGLVSQDNLSYNVLEAIRPHDKGREATLGELASTKAR